MTSKTIKSDKAPKAGRTQADAIPSAASVAEAEAPEAVSTRETISPEGGTTSGGMSNSIEARPPTGDARPVSGKLGLMVGLLRRDRGATLDELVENTGWQKHSVRGAMAGALKTRGFAVTSTKADGARTYRIVEDQR